MEIKFYFCDHCKNVAIKVVDHKVPLFCCGEKMTELVPWMPQWRSIFPNIR